MDFVLLFFEIFIPFFKHMRYNNLCLIYSKITETNLYLGECYEITTIDELCQKGN